MKKHLFLLLLPFLISGCVTTQIAHLDKKNDKDVEVYMTKVPTANYTEVTYIEASGGIFHNKKQLLRKLKQKAVKEGADALIEVKFSYTFWWPYAEGIAVKYDDRAMEQ